MELKSSITYLSGSGWVEGPAELQPAVSGEVSCDVAVVGGGLGGMLAALRLAELGHDVVLLEADLCGWGASARNAGYVTATVGSAPWVLKRFYGERARDLIRFANTAVTFTENLIASRRIDCDYVQTGFVAASATAAGFKRMRAKATSGKRSVVGNARELGIPPAFNGGVHIKFGGSLNPGRFSLGVRDLVLASTVRVFEQSPVREVSDTGTGVKIEVPAASIRASRAILTVNAFSNQLSITPRHLARLVWVTAVETEPVSAEQVDRAGWTSRLPLLTTHQIMHSFRITPRDTILHTTRRLQAARRADRHTVPSQAVVNDLIRGFRERLPTLAGVSSMRAWGGWIGEAPANMAVAGQASSHVYYSLACNGHGLPQAPYVGSLLADYLGGQGMHENLRAVWRDSTRFMPGFVNPVTLNLGWVADRAVDRLDRLR